MLACSCQNAVLYWLRYTVSVGSSRCPSERFLRSNATRGIIAPVTTPSINQTTSGGGENWGLLSSGGGWGQGPVHEETRKLSVKVPPETGANEPSIEELETVNLA